MDPGALGPLFGTWSIPGHPPLAAILVDNHEAQLGNDARPSVSAYPTGRAVASLRAPADIQYCTRFRVVFLERKNWGLTLPRDRGG